MQRLGATICARSVAKFDEDEREQAARASWLDTLKAKAASAEADKLQLEQERRAQLAAMAEEPAKVKTKSVNGYFVCKMSPNLPVFTGPECTTADAVALALKQSGLPGLLLFA